MDNIKNLESLNLLKNEIINSYSDFIKIKQNFDNLNIQSKILQEHKKLFTKKFFYKLSNKVNEYNEQRYKYFYHNKSLDSSIINKIILKNDSLLSCVDASSAISQSFDIKTDFIINYLKENNLVIFPSKFLKDSLLNPQKAILNQLNSKHHTFVLSTIDNIDLFKVISHNPDISQFISFDNNQNILNSFFFQIPLFKNIFNKLDNLSKEQSLIKEQVLATQNNLSKFVHQQNINNQNFADNFNQVYKNLTSLNYMKYELDEKERRANPYFYTEDTSITLVEQVYKTIGTNDFGYEIEVPNGFRFYHPIIKVLKEKTPIPERFQYVKPIHIKIDLNSSVDKNSSVSLENTQKLLIEEKCNNILLLSSSQPNELSNLKVLYSLGAGFNPLLQSDFSFVNEQSPKLSSTRKKI